MRLQDPRSGQIKVELTLLPIMFKTRVDHKGGNLSPLDPFESQKDRKNMVVFDVNIKIYKLISFWKE